MSSNGVVDITILGAGPSGLAAAYYAGHRDASVRIVESLEQLGGQVAAVYPEKHVYDVAGHPKILGTALVHRRDNFRALESSVNEAKALEGEGRIRIMTPCEIREVHGDGVIQAVTI